MHHTDHIIPSEPRPLPADGALYFVGIGGAGMSAIAQVLAERGRTIYGADPGISATVKARLEAVGATVYTAHEGRQLGPDISAVVVSDAIPQANPEVIAARERDIPIYRRPEVLGAIVNAGRGIAIAGTHGKTTTTGMVASILMAAGLDPTVLIGGDLPLIGGNARNGKEEFVVAESCEAYDGFLYLHPEVAVILNIEADHLDYHGTEQHVFESFRRFLTQVKPNGCAIGCWEDSNTQHILGDVDETLIASGAGSQYYAIGTNSPVHTEDLNLAGARPSFTLCASVSRDLQFSVQKWHVVLQVPGRHNVLNALAAASVGFSIGIAPEHVVAGLESFTGTGRRFEKLGEINGITVIDDYAHHPTELRATLAAARSAFPDRRIVAVFQPHLPSRTRDLMDEFASALTPPAPLSLPRERGEKSTGGDTLSPLPWKGEGGRGGEGSIAVYLSDIYLAREQPIPGVSSETLAQRITALPNAPVVTYVPNKADFARPIVGRYSTGRRGNHVGRGRYSRGGRRVTAIVIEW